MSKTPTRFQRRSENIFELQHPELYNCQIESYKTGLADLRIGAHRGNEFPSEHSVQLLFTSPYFFDGPLGWKSADFRLGTLVEKLELLKTLGWVETASKSEEQANLAELLELFLVTSTNYEIRILASDAYRLD